MEGTPGGRRAGHGATLHRREPRKLTRLIATISETIHDAERIGVFAIATVQAIGRVATSLTANGIKTGKLKRLPVAVPPLGKQHRIVSKVGALLAI